MPPDGIIKTRIAQEPQVVVVELGANDGFRGLELKDIEANLRAILHRIREGGAVPLLLRMQLPPSYGATWGWHRRE